MTTLDLAILSTIGVHFVVWLTHEFRLRSPMSMDDIPLGTVATYKLDLTIKHRDTSRYLTLTVSAVYVWSKAYEAFSLL